MRDMTWHNMTQRRTAERSMSYLVLALRSPALHVSTLQRKAWHCIICVAQRRIALHGNTIWNVRDAGEGPGST
eukprot:917174-Pyramimonas_sp.AAC.1